MLLRRLLTAAVVQLGGELRVPKSFFAESHAIGIDTNGDDLVVAVDMDRERRS